MVIGMKYGSSDPADLEAKGLSREKTLQLMEMFEKTHGSTLCNTLVGFDRSNLSGVGLIAKLPHFHSICPKFLETAIAYLERIGTLIRPPPGDCTQKELWGSI